MNERCKGVTKSGRQCKMTTNLVNGYCRLHRHQGTEGGGQPQQGRPLSGERDTTDQACTCSCSPWYCLAALLAIATVVILVLIMRKRMRNGRTEKRPFFSFSCC